MRHRIQTVLGVSIVLLATVASSTVHADDDTSTTDAPVTTEAPVTTAPKPTVSITVADVPIETDPPSTAGDITQPSVLPDPKPTAPSTTEDAPSTTEDAVGPPSATTTTTTTPGDEDETPSTGTVAAASTTVAVVPTSTLNPNQNHSDQETQVTGTQVAGANTGSNLTNNDTPATGSVPANSIGSGDATAVGSADQNTVTQGADVVLTDQALANVLQVALILNIGAALANSGANSTAATPGGSGAAGDIGTGNADATGLDMSQYITQAARAAGDENTDDAAKQLAVSLWMGIAQANTGTNAITGADGGTGTGGAVGTGTADATGNRSLTDILQGAQVNGSGTSQTNVEQYATVLNMGFALANSGVNDVAGVANGLLAAGSSDEQNQMAVDLFSMLLPALMSSYASTGGAGSIGTGNATAVGNDSQTYVQQLAMAANSGDGIASIIQNVLVANVGAAGANTGGNAIGGSYASLDPQTAKAVVTLAAFLSQMLAMVHTSASDQAKTLQEQGIEVPFGDIILTVQGAMQQVDTTLTNPTGAKANVRQVTIVLSLGYAQANSGINRAINDSGDPGAMALMSGNDFTTAVNDPDLADKIRTANATAGNEGLVIICQRRNADDIACLAPPPPPDNPGEDTPPVDTPPTQQPVNEPQAPPQGPVVIGTQDIVFQEPTSEPRLSLLSHPEAAVRASNKGGLLPQTGADTDQLLYVAEWMLGIGLATVTVTRRRRRSV